MFFLKRTPKNNIPPDENQLLAAYQKSRDLSVLADLYRLQTHLVFGTCLKYLKDEDSAKDAVMQIFEKLAEELHKHEVKNFKSWLYVLSRNYCLMELRKQKNRPEDSFSEIFSERMEFAAESHPFDEEKEENLQRLEKAVESLPEDQKRCIRLFYLEEKSYKETARLTGFEIKKVKSYIQNGRRMLKIRMEENVD